jgi:hypothetical protein
LKKLMGAGLYPGAIFLKISDWRVRISSSCNLIYIKLIEFNTGSKAMKYKPSRLSFVLTGLMGAAVILASSGVYAGSGASVGSQHSLVSSHEDGVDEAKPVDWVGEYGQLTIEDVTIEERSVDDWLDRRSSTPGTGIGMGVAPLFDTHGVFRTSGYQDKSTYVALGYFADELTMEEAGTSDARGDSGFSYGIGVNNATSNFEYMMSVDEENYGVSAIGMRFTSEF